MDEDRSAAALLAIARAADEGRLYRALYGGRVVAQSDDLATVDVKLDDPRLPGMGGVPLRLPIAGVRVRLRVARGATPSAADSAVVRVLVGFENGDPTRDYALLVEAPAAALDLVTFAATNTVELGTAGADEPLVLGGTFRGAQASLDATLLAQLTAAAAGLAAAAAAGSHTAAQPGLAAAGTALAAAAAGVQAFEAQAGQYLSSKVRTV